jgi:prepilin-type N-terminal cleavage/methylation domain-containing protein
MKSSKKSKSGFTLIELLVVVGIIAILAAVVVASLNNARKKGGDAGIKSNLINARAQGEIFYNTNTAVPATYTSVCTNGAVGGAQGVGALVLAAATAGGLTSYAVNTTGTLTTATCNDSSSAWAAEVPLKSAGVNQLWCVDSTGASKQKSASIGAGTVC